MLQKKLKILNKSKIGKGAASPIFGINRRFFEMPIFRTRDLWF
jgi:hypothetical protein